MRPMERKKPRAGLRTHRYSLALLGTVLSLSTAVPVWGHDLGVIRGELVQVDTARYTLELELAAGLEPLELIYPERCWRVGKAVSRPQQGFTLLSVELDCGAKPLDARDVIRLPWPRDGALVQARWLDGLEEGRFFEGVENGILLDVGLLRGESRPAAETVWHFASFGVEHILAGWDHLAFVLCLVLLARGWALVGQVTAFTMGHSLSLILAVLGLVRLPALPVEACIALSIAFMAREALVRPGSAVASRHSGWGLVFAFGLLHGLGFAGALTEGGIAGSELVLGLLTFNLGVEIGQLLFVAALMVVVTLGSRLPIRAFVGRGVAYALGSLGIFWTVERLTALQG